MFRSVLLKLFCSFITLQIVLTQNDLGEVIEKLRSNENFTQEWMETYLETLKNLNFENNPALSDLQAFERFLNYLNEEQSQLLVNNVEKFIQELIHSSFKFESLMKSERESRILNLNENEGSGDTEEEDLKQVLEQIFTDLILLKSKLIDLSKNIPLLIEMMEENGEISEQNTEENFTSNLAGRSNFIGSKVRLVSNYAGRLIRMLDPNIFGNMPNKDQGNTSEVEELEEEIEELLSEFEESDEPFSYWQESEKDQMETENLNEIEDEYSEVMSQREESQNVPEEFVSNEEPTSKTNREARKLFDKIKVEQNDKYALNESSKNNGEGSVKIFRKTFKIFSKDEVKKDQPKETSDEKWKVKVYNKVFKDNTDKEKEVVADQTHDVMKETQTNTEYKATNAGETKENIFEQIFGNKKDTNEKLKKSFKKIIGENDSKETNKNDKLMDKNDRNQKQILNPILENFDKYQNELESENSIYENQSSKKSFYDKIRNKTELVGNKTNNFTDYLGSLKSGLYAAANSSLLNEIIEGLRDGKDDLTKNVRQKFSNVAKSLFQTSSKDVESDESKIDTSKEDSSKLFKKSKLDSSPVPTEDKNMEKPSYVTLTSTYYTVLLATTTTNVVFEKTVTFTSTEVIETLLNPATTNVKGLPIKTKAAEKYLKPIESSSVMTKNTETKSESLKNVILDKFNLA